MELDEKVPKGKRELIIKAAEKIFSEKGFFQSKVEEIAVEAGVGKGTVYEYFASKQEVFLEMLKEISKDLNLEYSKSDPASAVEKIKVMVGAHLTFMVKHRSMARVLMQEHLTMTDDLYDFMKQDRENTLKYIKDIIIDGMKKGELREDIDFEITAHLIMGATISLSGDIILGDDARTVEELTDHVVEMMLYGIAASRWKKL